MSDPDRQLGNELDARRPVPSRQFSDGLRDHLLELDARHRRPAQLWLLISAYALAGVVLLVVAAIASGGGGL